MSKSAERLVILGAVGVFVAGSVLGMRLVVSQPEAVAEEPACEVPTSPRARTSAATW